MRKGFLWLVGLVLARVVLSAAVSVGPAGGGNISFDTRPLAAEWSTRSLPGNELAFTDAAGLASAIQTNAAVAISNAVVDAGAASPPGQNTLAAWSSGGGSIWTRPTGNGATLLMATLVNDTGVNQDRLRIVYSLAQSGATPTEQLPAHQVYYSLSGAPESWVNIAALSGEGTGLRSNLVALAGTWTNGAPLFVLWADDNTVGGVDRGYAIDDVLFACNTAPALEFVPDMIADVLQIVAFRAAATDADTPPNRLVHSLEAAPAAARFNSTNGLFRWATTRADADTTNVITLRVTDDGAPPLHVERTFTVIVRDYVETSLGFAVVDVGQGTNVSIGCATTVPLTNLALTILLPTERLTDLALENLRPGSILAASDTSQAGRVTLMFAALPGQTLSGTQQLARLHFTAAAGQSSAFLPLLLSETLVQRAAPGLAPTLLRNHGRVVAVGGHPLIEAAVAGATRTLTLYGRPGTNYLIETATSVPGLWQPWRSVAFSNLVETTDASSDASAPVIFYRVRE